MRKFRFIMALSALALLGGCLVQAPSAPERCAPIDTDGDGSADYMECAGGCVRYDADGDAALDDRVCKDAATGCTSLDLNDDGSLDGNNCVGPTGCSLMDADGDSDSDDTFCAKVQGCFVIDLNSDGTIDADNCLGCNEWESFGFALDADVASGCNGERFVFFHAGYQKFIGAILCSPTRYKLVMSDDLDAPFANIGDASGGGQDHCELVNPDFSLPNEDDITSGGCTTCSLGATVSRENSAGFVRDSFGESFVLDEDWIPNYFTPIFYECGIALPVFDEGCAPDPACVALDRDGDGLLDTFDCSAVNGCVGADFNEDGIIDAAVCDPEQQP